MKKIILTISIFILFLSVGILVTPHESDAYWGDNFSMNLGYYWGFVKYK